MKRQDTLDLIRIKSAKGDEQGALTVYIEARNVSYPAFLKELRAGRAYLLRQLAADKSLPDIGAGLARNVTPRPAP